MTSPSTTTETQSTEAEAEAAVQKAQPAGAPEAYADFKAPEGYTIAKDVLDAAVPLFKELGLSQDQAQKLIDAQSARDITQAKATENLIARTRKEWTDEVMANPELGPNLEKIKTDIGRALDSMGKPQLKQKFAHAMDLTGAGDNPAFIEVFKIFAERMNEGTHVAGASPSPAGQGKPSSSRPSLAQSMYPNLTPQ